MWERHLAAIFEHFKANRNPPEADYRAKDDRLKSILAPAAYEVEV
jgi:hypothetical protein